MTVTAYKATMPVNPAGQTRRSGSAILDRVTGKSTEILTSLCARLYGRRSAVNRARRAVEAATQDGLA